MLLIRVRAVFEKTGRAKYISHLDLNRCMLRIFRRSKLPIWYTEGFHTHPYYSFALALSLGFESHCEILDFNLNDDDISLDYVCDTLNGVMPEGMRILSVAPQVKKITEIGCAEYTLSLVTERPDELSDKIGELLASEEILVEKKTKRGMKTVDIKPSLDVLGMEKSAGSVDMRLRLPAGTETNYNPSLFFKALGAFTDIPFTPERICRTGIYCKNGEVFA